MSGECFTKQRFFLKKALLILIKLVLVLYIVVWMSYLMRELLIGHGMCCACGGVLQKVAKEYVYCSVCPFLLMSLLFFDATQR